MMATTSNNHIPATYRIFFTLIDPLIAGSGAFWYLFNPAFSVNAFLPASITPYNPLYGFLCHQLGGALSLCVILHLFLLRRTREIWIWKTVQAGQLFYDAVMLVSEWVSLKEQGRLSFQSLRFEDWGNIIIVATCALMRTAFCLGVGLQRSIGRSKSS